jgi:diguanylate cyclase (GGDEF)-like protein
MNDVRAFARGSVNQQGCRALLEDGGKPVARAQTDTVVLVGADPRGTLWIGEMLQATWRGQLRLVYVQGPPEAADELVEHPSAWVLLDISSLYADPVGAVSELRTLAPGAPIVVLGDSDDGQKGLAAIQAGAQDYLIKSELYPAILRRALMQSAERLRGELQLTHQALHDPLTGLPNRALFLDRLGVALDRCRRSGAAVAVLFLDVDNFKRVNDSLGHAAGDRVLVGLADRLRTMLRPMDTVCRYGGDEFTLLLEDLDNEREVALIAERISQAAALPIRLELGATEVTVSIGIAVVSDPDAAADTVIREADAAMYRAKRSGPSHFELFDEGSRRRAMERLELEHGLRRALERSELCVYYQPRFSLEDPGQVRDLEALVRWRHPDRGLVAPGEFIALAEETGLIIPIGHFVLEQALRQIPSWRRHAPEVTVSVNISARQLEDVSAVQPRALCLEFAEEAISERPDSAVRTMQGLKAMGVRLAIDDFGLGTSSLSRLRRLPVDTLKIHESLLGGLGRSSRDGPLVGAVVDLGHALGLNVVAEGVETEAQMSELRALGCDGAQGFWLGRPVAEEDVQALLSPQARATASSSS